MIKNGNVTIYDNEAVEPLDDAHSIIQQKDGYRFGADAVELSKFACGFIKQGAAVFDLCSGCGIVGILVEIEKQAAVFGAEIDGIACDMSNRSVALNGLNAKFFNVDIRDREALADVKGNTRFDAVTVNPPFYKKGSKPSKVAPRASSELTVTFSDIAATAKSLLKPRGEFFVVHTAARLDEVLCVCRENKLTPKDLIVNKNGKTFLLRCVLGGGDGLKVSVRG
ncbi:MAG: methyltransferase [Clostridiales bacterium]|nr:methyltransferase [Clostridiales bacterium]